MERSKVGSLRIVGTEVICYDCRRSWTVTNHYPLKEGVSIIHMNCTKQEKGA